VCFDQDELEKETVQVRLSEKEGAQLAVTLSFFEPQEINLDVADGGLL